MNNAPPELRDSESSATLPRVRWPDVVGVAVQLVLTAAGLHAALAVGFTWWWQGQPLVAYRHPAVGLAVILFGVGLRWVISTRFRHRAAEHAREDVRRARAYAAGGTCIPWRAAFFWVFLPTLVIYQSNNRTIGSGDTAPMMATALSIVVDGDIALDEFVKADAPPYYVCRVGEHYYSRFSLGPALAAVPFVQLARWGGADLDDAIMRQRLEKVVASLIAAAAAMLMLPVLLRLADPAAAALLTIFFALASQNWSIASQALWQHGPVALCAAGVLLLEFHAGRRPGRWLGAWQGLLLGVAVGCRPTAVILAVAVVAYVAATRWRQLPGLAVAAAVAYAPFAALHLHEYHALLGPYVHAGAEAKWGADLRVSVPGNLISPARGVLCYQPLVVVAAVALIPRCTRRIGTGLAVALLAWCCVHLSVVSYYRHWWGGHAWGPRFLTELMPAMVVLMTPAVGWLWRRYWGRWLVITLTVWSIGLQALGVYSPDAQEWMTRPVDIDRAPQRLWDWSDPPFLYPWRAPGVTP